MAVKHLGVLGISCIPSFSSSIFFLSLFNIFLFSSDIYHQVGPLCILLVYLTFQIFNHVLPFDNGCPTTSYRLNKKTACFTHLTTEYHLCDCCHSPVRQNKCSNETCPSHEDKINILHFTIFDIKTQLIKIIKGNILKVNE